MYDTQSASAYIGCQWVQPIGAVAYCTVATTLTPGGSSASAVT